MSTKPPVPQGISALLRKAGFRPSVPRPGVGRWDHGSRIEGYQVRAGAHPDLVTVLYHPGGRPGAWQPGGRERAGEQLKRYAEVLMAAGYEVRQGGDTVLDGITVAAGNDSANEEHRMNAPYLGLAKGDEVLVVEHDPASRKPRAGGHAYPAAVADLPGAYVVVRYDETGIPGTGRLDTFWASSGWRAWDGGFCWRLARPAEATR